MAKNIELEGNEEEYIPKYSVDHLAESKKFSNFKDALRAVLDKKQMYTIDEAEEKLNSFLKGGK